jgi:hypothetical protein
MAKCRMDGCGNLAVPNSNYCMGHRPGKPSKSLLAAAGGPGSGDSQLVCPHCGVKGRVRSKAVKVKRGISGGKATGAVLTAGFSLLATGLSRKQRAVERVCSNCQSVWTVDS